MRWGSDLVIYLVSTGSKLLNYNNLTDFALANLSLIFFLYRRVGNICQHWTIIFPWCEVTKIWQHIFRSCQSMKMFNLNVNDILQSNVYCFFLSILRGKESVRIKTFNIINARLNKHLLRTMVVTLFLFFVFESKKI